ncbi:MAG: Uma2 family endonuclease [Actinomycetales bacterium]|nr:Uma2 family endonuclease [Actinomycetales bacterium]
MGVMTALTDGRMFTHADLEAMPDDGNRYELVDGLIVVTPSPSPAHQRVSAELFFRLRLACSSTLRVLTAPLDVVLADDTVLQPDILVADPATFTERHVLGAPLLAVEILSPSTRRYDLDTKKSAFERAGCPAYWVIDPSGPSITAWKLHEGSYRQAQHITGEATFTTQTPFPVAFRPSELLR